MAIKFKTKAERDRYLASLHREPPVVPSPVARKSSSSSAEGAATSRGQKSE